MQFFGRHGDVTINHNLSKNGEKNILSLKMKLRRMGFSPRSAISSTAERCKQTANILTSSGTIIESSLLHNFPEYDFFLENDGIVGAGVPEKVSFSKWKDALGVVMGIKPDVIISHDCLPVILAFKLIEARGGTVDWDMPREIRNLDMGHGILVAGTKYQYVTPN